MKFNSILAKKFRKKMDFLGWTQADLAKKSDLSQSTISRILSGKELNVNSRSVEKIALALGLSSPVKLNKTDVAEIIKAEDKKIYKIFFSCPSDVQDEYQTLKDVVDELNLENVQFQVISWKTHASPDFGTEPQAVINDFIGEEYDIFLGIMSTRFGSPTENYKSGTEEEFTKAYQRWKDSNGSIALMLYFKESDINPYELDIDQFNKVKEFRKSIRDQGLYWTFKSKDELSKYLRIHLPRTIQRLREKSHEYNNVVSENDYNHINQEEEEGILDLIDRSFSSFTRAGESLKIISYQITDLGNKINLRTNEINEINKNGSATLKSIKKVGDDLAKDMHSFCNRVQNELPIFSESGNSGFTSISKAINIAINYDLENFFDLKNFLIESEQLISAFDISLQGSEYFRQQLIATPGVTTSMNREKNRVIKFLETFIFEINEFKRVSNEIIDTIKSN